METSVTEQWANEFKRVMNLIFVEKELCSHCLSNSPTIRCKTTGFLFCSNKCHNENWNKIGSVYKYAYNELIGAGGKRERSPGGEGEEEKESEERKRKKDLLEKEAAKRRSETAREAAKWIEENKPAGAGKERVRQLLSILKINRSFLKTLLKNTDNRTIASWILVSPEFLEFIWNNGYFWYLYLARYEPATLLMSVDHAGYDRRNDKIYSRLGKRAVHVLNNSMGIIIAKNMVRNEEAMKLLMPTMTVSDLKNYFLTSYGFTTLIWNSPYFWYYFAKHNGLLPGPGAVMNQRDIDHYRQISLAVIYPRCKYYLNMHYTGVEQNEESFEIIANAGDNIVQILEEKFIQLLDSCTVTRNVPYTQTLPALDYMFNSDCTIMYNDQTYSYVNGSFDGANIRDMLGNLPDPEYVEDKEIHISCYCGYYPPKFEVSIHIPNELEVIRGMEKGKSFDLPFETMCTAKMTKAFSDHLWPVVWGVKGENDFEKEQQELNEYAIVVSFHGDEGVFVEEDETLVIPSIFVEPFTKIMDTLSGYDWAGHHDETVEIQIEILKGEK